MAQHMSTPTPKKTVDSSTNTFSRLSKSARRRVCSLFDRPDRRALLATNPATTSIYSPYVCMPHTHLVLERNYHAKKTRHLLGNWIVHLLLHRKPNRCPARGTSECQGISTKGKRRCSTGESKRRRQQAQANCREEQGLMHCDHVTARYSPTVFYGWCRDGGR